MQSMDLKSFVRSIPDFPKPGILFRDISPLLANAQALDFVAREMVKDIDLASIDAFAGVESRGFLLAMLLAAKYQKGFIPIRKAGKLPPPVVARSYKLEYGEAALEMSPGKGNLVIVDDVLATGGTLEAAIHVAQAAGYNVKDVRVLIDLKDLNQFRFSNKRVFSLMEF
ncbi:MAG: adenine phosphoribosyltransferase [Bdellovibrionaceae bacterium]|nr:adenine phosphoribosyltransferase [Pseudobdellovibrionaceae bacterium]